MTSRVASSACESPRDDKCSVHVTVGYGRNVAGALQDRADDRRLRGGVVPRIRVPQRQPHLRRWKRGLKQAAGVSPAAGSFQVAQTLNSSLRHLLRDVIRLTDRQRHNGECRILRRPRGELTPVGDKQVGDVVALAVLVDYPIPCFLAHPVGAKIVSRWIGGVGKVRVAPTAS